MKDDLAPVEVEPAEAPAVSIDVLMDGAKKACANAEALFAEAKLLGEHGAIARALCLHQISLEECSKLEFLGAWSMSLVRGHELNPRRAASAFSSHTAKNKLNAYMLDPSEAELEAREKGDWAASLAEFQKTQNEFHRVSNNNKNASLYVDWTGTEFVAPVDAITVELVAEISELNERFIKHAQLQLRMFERLQSEGDVLKPELAKLMETLEGLRTDSVEARIAGSDAAMAEFFEAVLSKRNEA